MAGSTSSFGSGEEDVFLLKYSMDGQLIWNRTWGGMGSDTARTVAVVGDGVCVAGVTYGVGNNGQAFLLRYTSPNDSTGPITDLILRVALLAVGMILWLALTREALLYLRSNLTRFISMFRRTNLKYFLCR